MRTPAFLRLSGPRNPETAEIGFKCIALRVQRKKLLLKICDNFDGSAVPIVYAIEKIHQADTCNDLQSSAAGIAGRYTYPRGVGARKTFTVRNSDSASAPRARARVSSIMGIPVFRVHLRSRFELVFNLLVIVSLNPVEGTS
jgi:hypothetical protein